jgi:hypothetical protein
VSDGPLHMGGELSPSQLTFIDFLENFSVPIFSTLYYRVFVIYFDTSFPTIIRYYFVIDVALSITRAALVALAV